MLAHRTTTGPEIWAQMAQRVDAFVAGVGTGGTLTGAGGFLKEMNPELTLILADPQGSVLAHYVTTGELTAADKWLVEGIGEDFIPPICDLALVDRAYTVSDAEAFSTVRELLQREGIMAGSSSGVLLEAALRYCREQSHEQYVVTLLPDNGARYISKVFNDDWMLDQGFMARPMQQDLRDLILHPHQEQTTVTVQPNDIVRTALNRAKLHQISQLPVLEDDKLVGIIDEWDMLTAVYANSTNFDQPVSHFMSAALEVINYRSPVDELIPIFARDQVAIVMDGSNFLGIITKIDLINYLRN